MIGFKGALRVAALAFCGALAASAAEARDIKVQRKAPVKVAAVEASAATPAPLVVTDVTPAPVAAAALAAPEAPACARKVKVIYAGYGEASRAACETAALSPSDLRR